MAKKCGLTKTLAKATGLPHSGDSNMCKRFSSAIRTKWSRFLLEALLVTWPVRAAFVRAFSQAAIFTAYPSGFVFFCKAKSEYREGSRFLIVKIELVNF